MFFYTHNNLDISDWSIIHHFCCCCINDLFVVHFLHSWKFGAFIFFYSTLFFFKGEKTTNTFTTAWSHVHKFYTKIVLHIWFAWHSASCHSFLSVSYLGNCCKNITTPCFDVRVRINHWFYFNILSPLIEGLLSKHVIAFGNNYIVGNNEKAYILELFILRK